MAEIWTREFQEWDGSWQVGANGLAQNADEIRFRKCVLPPDASPQLREMAAQMCADDLARELHAATD